MAIFLETERGKGKPPARRLWLGFSFRDENIGPVVRAGLNTVRNEYFNVDGDYDYRGPTYKGEEINGAKLRRTVRRIEFNQGKLDVVPTEQRLVYAPLFSRRASRG